ncbi:MAG: FAD-binding protein, partial [Candidatus Saliniplasma sp.]
MGGILVDNDCETDVPGLYAAGECSCVSVHGANRLGGNSLLETVVFGKIAGKKASEEMNGKELDESIFMDAIEKDSKLIDSIVGKKEGILYSEILKDLRETMFQHFGVFREGETMEEGLDKIKRLKGKFEDVYVESDDKKFNQALIRTLELRNMLLIAEAVAMGAVRREESRGSHYRTDFTERRDEQYLKHTVVRKGVEGPELEYSPVNLDRFEVKEREY